MAFELTDNSILELIKSGTIIKEFKLSKDVTVYFKNLTQEDREAYSKLIEIPKSENNTDINNTLYIVMEASKVPLLCYAITKINDVDFSTKESKSALLKLLRQFPPVVVDKLYEAHLENENNFVSLFNNEDLKKN